MIKYYGTESETIIKNSKGEFYIIQSVDFPEGKEYEKLQALPDGASELDPVACQDLIIPEGVGVTLASRALQAVERYYENIPVPERNEWEDVFYNFGIDAMATNRIDPGYTSGAVVFNDGSRLLWSEPDNEWQER